MNESFKSWGVAVVSAIAISSLGIAGNTYVDVQVLKHNQLVQKELSDQQRNMTDQIQGILSAIDKQMAVQTETVKALSDAVSELKSVKGKR